MGQPAAEVVAEKISVRIAGQPRKHLRFSCEAPECAGVQNAGGVAGKGRAIGVGRFGMGAAREFRAFSAASGNGGRQPGLAGRGLGAIAVDNRHGFNAQIWL